MVESPDELAVQYEHLAAKIAERHRHQLSPAAADFDDLKQVAWMAVLQAARTFDPARGVPWGQYAGLVARRAVNAFIRVQRRRGLTRVGDKAHDRTDAPTTVGLGDRAECVPDRAASSAADTKELLDRLAAGADWIDPRALEAAELIVRHGLTQVQVAWRMGVTRQRVAQILAPLREYLREALDRIP